MQGCGGVCHVGGGVGFGHVGVYWGGVGWGGSCRGWGVHVEVG